MTTVTRSLVVLTAAAAISAGCGSSSGKPSATTTATATDAKTTSTQVSTAPLKAAVRAAIRANVQLSTYVLWHNHIPAWATRSTRGPALKALRSAAATRRKQGIRIKNLAGGYTISSIELAPSYATATAVIRSHQRVAPYKSGHRLGKAISASDHARIQLHRLGDTKRFVVWRVVTTK
jgi:hypothetical protein